MKTLKASFINDGTGTVETLHSLLNQQEKHLLEFLLWKSGNEKLQVVFSIAHNQESVLLKFFVTEKQIRAEVTKTNGRVWEDSCVEFFVSFDERGYYNFEFNCIGTVLAAFGSNRNQRTFLPEAILQKIETHTELTKKHDGFYWAITIVIPKETFVHHSLPTLSGTFCRANFYKCGDGLSQPHYLSWNKIESADPDFHLPQFFGELLFL